MDENHKEDKPELIPIEGVLDLHTFDKKEIGGLIREYIEECRKKCIFEIRIIHGKGKGVLRARVHSILSKIDLVKSYRTANDWTSSWGATIVTLRDNENCSEVHED
ncbi:Smr/MutS family protein [candidate division WOR-3 bacterium]|nr:Smr/MutS family protein [candidate division WOR-3 bacterium]